MTLNGPGTITTSGATSLTPDSSYVYLAGGATWANAGAATIAGSGFVQASGAVLDTISNLATGSITFSGDTRRSASAATS